MTESKFASAFNTSVNRAIIAADITDFLASGGKIERIALRQQQKARVKRARPSPQAIEFAAFVSSFS
jgi:hypothetical protein